jgi:hypothetical protein
MEGQVPWMRNKKTNTAVAAAATPAPMVPVPVPPTPAIAAAVTQATLSSLYEDVSFAALTEITDNIAFAISLPFSTILDSGVKE